MTARCDNHLTVCHRPPVDNNSGTGMTARCDNHLTVCHGQPSGDN